MEEIKMNEIEFEFKEEYTYANNTNAIMLDILLRLSKKFDLLSKNEELLIENILNKEIGLNYTEKQVDIVMDYLDALGDKMIHKSMMVLDLEKKGIDEYRLLNILDLLYFSDRYVELISRIGGLKHFPEL